MFFAPTPRNHENPHFVASRALIKNRLGESSNLAHRGMHAKFQLIWAVRLVRAMGVVKIESSSYNWRKPVVLKLLIYRKAESLKGTVATFAVTTSFSKYAHGL